MINLRYHIVSLVAVFLALAIGVIAGTTVIDQNLVTNLRSQQRTLANLRAQTQSENDALKAELSLWDSFGALLEPSMIRDRLKGRSVVLVGTADADAGLMDDITDTVVGAGAIAAGRILFTNRWALADDTARDQLALALAEPRAPDPKMRSDAGARLAARLKTPADPSIDTDLIRALERAGFVTTHDLSTPMFPLRGSLIIVVGSGRSDDQPPDDELLTPMLKAFAGAPVAVVEPLNAAESLVGRVIDDGELRQTVATVDHVDTIPGKIALVEGLRRVAQSLAAPHYGLRRQTSGIAPSPSP